MIPPKITLAGDHHKARGLSAFALSQLRVLQSAMKFRNLKQDVRRLRFENGSYIIIESSFGRDTIRIFVPPIPEVKRVEEEEVGILEAVVKGGVLEMYAGIVEVAPCDGVPTLAWEEGNPTKIGRLGATQFTVRGGVPAMDPVKLLGIDSNYYWTLTGGEGYWFNSDHTEREQVTTTTIRGACEGAYGLDEVECLANGGIWIYAGARVLIYTSDTICAPCILTVSDICGNEVQMEIGALNDLAWVSSFGPQLPCRYDVALVVEIEYGKPPFNWWASSTKVGFVPVVEDCTNKATTLEVSDRVVGLCIDDLDCGRAVQIYVEDSCEGQISMEIESVTPDAPVEWDDDGSDDTIDASGTATVKVKNGQPPYEWFVTGTDVSFPVEKTDTLENTLVAGASACGAITVTVFDCCGVQTSGGLRCTTGSWSAWAWKDQFDCSGILANTYIVDPVCSGVSNIYAWRARVYESLTPPPICPNDYSKQCDGWHGHCYPDVTDGICSYIADAETLGSVYGIPRLVLYRKDWGC